MAEEAIKTQVQEGNVWKKVELKYTDTSIARLRRLYDDKVATSLLDVFKSTKKVSIAYSIIQVVFFIISCYFLIKCLYSRETFYVLDILLILGSLKILSAYRNRCTRHQSMVLNCYKDMRDVIDYLGRGATLTTEYLDRKYMNRLRAVRGASATVENIDVSTIPQNVDGVLTFKLFGKMINLVPIKEDIFDGDKDNLCLDLDRCADQLMDTLNF